MSIKVIAFDADDTLWVNEPYFRDTEKLFCALLEDYLPEHSVEKELFKIEMQNLALYGYGVKGFMLSMIETALSISDNKIPPIVINKILQLGKDLLAKPIELLDGVEQVLQCLQGSYKLVVATKGDLLDQERKLRKSGIEPYFHHIEIMSDKQASDYQKLIKHLDIQANEILMIGNSLKSDIIPVLALGGYGIHVPYHTTWAHEQIEQTVVDEKFQQMHHIAEVVPFLKTIK
jgi:putative hydrolase of the HAD superfamily